MTSHHEQLCAADTPAQSQHTFQTLQSSIAHHSSPSPTYLVSLHPMREPFLSNTIIPDVHTSNHPPLWANLSSPILTNLDLPIDHPLIWHRSTLIQLLHTYTHTSRTYPSMCITTNIPAMSIQIITTRYRRHCHRDTAVKTESLGSR